MAHIGNMSISFLVDKKNTIREICTSLAVRKNFLTQPYLLLILNYPQSLFFSSSSLIFSIPTK